MRLFGLFGLLLVLGFKEVYCRSTMAIKTPASVLLLFLAQGQFVTSVSAECCALKTVGDYSYTLTTWEGAIPDECKDSCAYTKDGYGESLYCFAPGYLNVVCLCNPCSECNGEETRCENTPTCFYDTVNEVCSPKDDDMQHSSTSPITPNDILPQCTLIATDIVTLNATCDDDLLVFADGEVIGDNKGDWEKSQSINVPIGTRVLGLMCKDTGGAYGIVASTDTGVFTNERWVCSSENITGWAQPGFKDEDNKFSAAKSGTQYDANPDVVPQWIDNVPQGIDNEAKSIWGPTPGGFAFCRTPLCVKHTTECDVNGAVVDHGECICNPGFAGNGFKCGNDSDSDGFPDEPLNCTEISCRQDNCPLFPNSGQEDADDDGVGDSCDDDSDNDGINDTTDNCPIDKNPGQEDEDSDGFGNICDNCPDNPNPLQNDADGDGIGDICEDDIDNDGIIDENDNCPFKSNVDQVDGDEDGLGDVCDNCPKHSNPGQEDENVNQIGDACEGSNDRDKDGMGDSCDLDKDGDEIEDLQDNCPLVPNPDQINTDNDEQGDACDDDDDGDNVLDRDDNCPLNNEISSTDFRGIKSIDLCITGCAQEAPKWEFRDQGREIWQGLNSRGSVAIGEDRLSSMDFSGTIFVDTDRDNDWVGFVFGFQDTSNFYVVYSSKHDSGQGPWKIVRVNSTTGPSRELDLALHKTISVPGQTEIIWQDPAGRGWKQQTPYRYLIKHRPIAGTMQLKIHEGAVELFDTGSLNEAGLAGGRVGVFCSSQEREIWSSMSYK